MFNNLYFVAFSPFIIIFAQCHSVSLMEMPYMTSANLPLCPPLPLSLTAGSSPPTPKGEKVAAALAVGCSVPAQSQNSLEFSLSWDMPKITFGSREREHTRYREHKRKRTHSMLV